MLASARVDELILADSDFDDRQLLEIVEQAHRRGVQVRVAPKTTALLTERAEYIPGQGTPLFELRPPAFAGTDWVVKRAFDLVVSVLVIVIGLPIWLAIAAAIKLASRGPVLYRDRRIGLNEQPFDDAEVPHDVRRRGRAPGASSRRRTRRRARCSRSATTRASRRSGGSCAGFSLDEIPQVLNVLRGEMSLVGPRPLPVRDYERLEDWHRKRYLVLPGMTGLWQIAGRADLSFDDLVRLDFYYLENWSIWLDISVLAKTVPAVLGRAARIERRLGGPHCSRPSSTSTEPSSPRQAGRVGCAPVRALITGVGGQDGSYLAEQLLADGHEVLGTVLGSPDDYPLLEEIREQDSLRRARPPRPRRTRLPSSPPTSSTTSPRSRSCRPGGKTRSG